MWGNSISWRWEILSLPILKYILTVRFFLYELLWLALNLEMWLIIAAVTVLLFSCFIISLFWTPVTCFWQLYFVFYTPKLQKYNIYYFFIFSYYLQGVSQSVLYYKFILKLYLSCLTYDQIVLYSLFLNEIFPFCWFLLDGRPANPHEAWYCPLFTILMLPTHF